MELFLIQHGIALPEDVDPLRPLSSLGEQQVVAVAGRAAAAGITVGTIWHSGKLRAEQTARLLATGMGAAAPQQRAGLNPSAPVAPTADWLISHAHHPAPVVVGHMPFLDRLSSLLVCAEQSANVIAWRNGALVKLVTGPEVAVGRFAVEWILAPQIA